MSKGYTGDPSNYDVESNNPEANDRKGYIRIVDESGEDYLYGAKGFEIIELPPRIERKLVATLR